MQCLLGKDDPNSMSRSLATITDDQGRRVEMWISEVGRMYETYTNQTFAGTNQTGCQDSVSVYDYDHLRLTSLQSTYNTLSQYNQWQSKLLVSNTYAYDLAGQRLSNQISSLDGGGSPTSRTELYSYDEQNRLKTVDYGDGQTQSYGFDAMGNRLSKSDSVNGSESYAFNAANMLTSRTVGGTANAYTNDIDGNTLTGGGRTNTWDSENRMVQCVNGANTSSFVYGSDGIRHRSTVNGTTTDFVLDASMFVREMTGSTVKATYFMGASGPAYRRDDVTSAVRWYLYDGLGSVLGEVDPNGTITATRKYDVYGSVRSSTGTSTSKHKFVGALGHPSEDETGLIYMRARYMNPATGRFISEDPGRQGDNWFTYCNSNPINQVDADGRFTIWHIVGVFMLWILGVLGTESIKAFFKELTNDYATMKNLAKRVKDMFKLIRAGGDQAINQGADQKVLSPVDDSEVTEATADMEIKGGMNTKIGAAFGSELADLIIEMIEEGTL